LLCACVQGVKSEIYLDTGRHLTSLRPWVCNCVSRSWTGGNA